jgi:uncharacterized membrane protein YozB (DUF420 family)
MIKLLAIFPAIFCMALLVGVFSILKDAREFGRQFGLMAYVWSAVFSTGYAAFALAFGYATYLIATQGFAWAL